MSALEALFDRMPDVVFFVKDRQGRYAAVNQTLLERCAVSAKRELIGRTTAEIFDPPLGGRFLEQDRQVLEAGVEI
ncbi:MAG: PAS domain-containing protein, partial [Holophagales bacterium]|nr:PAS domain-containing protein [Holophagales bacterium]